MATAGLYRRQLPSPPATDFGSAEGKMVLREALQAGTMEGFFQLIAHFQTQAEPAYCGLASLCVVLNALAIDPGRKWKGPWRWIDEAMLECCEKLEKVRAEGMTFAKVARVGACAGAAVQAIRTNKSSIDKFRQEVLECCSSESKHVIVSYDRRPLQQTGSGHFSPIGGYQRERDLVLILDVARFKYPPHWVPLVLLWDAMNTIDPTTSNLRGYILVSKPERRPSVLFTLSCKDELWRPITRYLVDDLPRLLSSTEAQKMDQALYLIVESLPGEASSFMKWIAEMQSPDTGSTNEPAGSETALNAKVKILEELRKTTLYTIVSNWSTCCGISADAEALEDQQFSDGMKQVCCQGAALLSGALTTSGFCCTKTTTTKKSVDGTEALVVLGELNVAGVQSNVNILVPTSQVCDRNCKCVNLHPASVDILAMILFALPPRTWSLIPSENLRADFVNATSLDNLQQEFQAEVRNLRRQFQIVCRMRDDNLEADLASDSFDYTEDL